MQTSDKTFFLIAVIFIIYTFIILAIFKTNQTCPRIFWQNNINVVHNDNDILELPNIYYNFLEGKWRGISKDEQAKFSELGKILFLDKDPSMYPFNEKQYIILIWKYGFKLKRRHVMHYTKRSYNPFLCSVKNCAVKYSNNHLASADLVIFDLGYIKNAAELPLGHKRNPKQIWAFLSDRSPSYMFPDATVNDISDFDGLFNWSMTYRMDSDIPVPYGRTLLLKNKQKRFEMNYHKWNENKYQNVLLAIVSSNCQGKNNRWDYIEALQKYLKIDTYGKCGNKECKTDYDNPSERIFNNCEEIINYKFYLAFENSNCNEYITEKVWWYGYSKNAIPIVMGGSKEYYEQLLPPYSYINTERFARPKDLANYILYLNRTASDIQQYFVWKKYFKVVNEHGYFQTLSQYYCRACQALNYNTRSGKSYDNLEGYWNEGKCHSSWNFHATSR